MTIKNVTSVQYQEQARSQVQTNNIQFSVVQCVHRIAAISQFTNEKTNFNSNFNAFVRLSQNLSIL
jgi:hypothetical protein